MSTTPDGDEIIGYGTYGDVRGFGPLRRTAAEASEDLDRDASGCAKQGGYSDREVVAVDSGGVCWSVDEDCEPVSWVPGPGGRTSGAARYEITEVLS